MSDIKDDFNFTRNPIAEVLRARGIKPNRYWEIEIRSDLKGPEDLKKICNALLVGKDFVFEDGEIKEK